MTETVSHISLPLGAETIANFCRRHHVQRLSVFGSYARGQQHSESDLDLLVIFESSETPDLLKLAGMEIELSDLAGRKVEIRMAEEISRYIRDRVMSEARVLYVH